MNEKEKCKELRKIILQASHDTHEGHVPTAFSIIEILYVLYHGVMNINPQNPDMPDRDILVVSKGHAAAGIYAVLADAGFFSMDELKRFGAFNGILGGHPDLNKVPGVEASTGSLGHGFPMAVGMAMGMKIRKSEQKVFCILGDGEANEGSVWEAIILAGQYKLDNLTCIFDYNHSIERSVQWGDIAAKFREFGWNATEVDGHDINELRKAFSHSSDGKPYVIIANTIKGKGCRTMEEEPNAWHHRAPNDEELTLMLSEIDQEMATI